ncbi:MAG: hypothetical protein ACJATU_000713 [Rickettsiales bacterium]|jgi:hypothetical protein
MRKSGFFESHENANNWGVIAFPKYLKEIKYSSSSSQSNSPNTFQRYVSDIKSKIVEKIMGLTRAIFPPKKFLMTEFLPSRNPETNLFPNSFRY